MKLELGIGDLKSEHMNVPVRDLVISPDMFNDKAQNALRIVGEATFYSPDRSFSHPVDSRPVYMPVESTQIELIKLLEAGWLLFYNKGTNVARLQRLNKFRAVEIELFHYMRSRGRIYTRDNEVQEQLYELRIS